MSNAGNRGLSRADAEALFAEAKSKLDPNQFQQVLAVAALAPIAEEVIEEGMVRQIFQTDRFSQGATTTYTLKKRMNAAAVIPKFGMAPSMIQRQERVHVEPYIIGHKHELNEIDIDDAQYNIVTESLTDAGKEIAIKEDNEMLRLLSTYAPDPGGAYPSSTETVTVSAGPGGQGTMLSTNVIRVGSSQTAPSGGATGDPTVQNIAVAQSHMQEIGYDTTDILTSPWAMGKFVIQDLFMHADKSGSTSVIDSGRITKDIMGVRWHKSRLVPRRSIYLMNSDELARWIERNALSIRTGQKDLMLEWFMWERACPFLRNANAYFRLIFNT